MKKSRLIVFPVEGRKWSFASTSCVCPANKQEGPLNLKQLWRRIASTDHSLSLSGKTDLVTHFVSDKMQQKWVALGMTPVGSIRHRVYSLGQQLLIRVKPSEMFLKSIPKETTEVEIVLPLSLNPRLVRRRLRCVATSGAIYHRRYTYGSVALLPFTALFAVLPLPNIPLFWNLFRAHAHWRALKGSERLLFLVSDSIESWNRIAATDSKDDGTGNSSGGDCSGGGGSCPWIPIWLHFNGRREVALQCVRHSIRKDTFFNQFFSLLMELMPRQGLPRSGEFQVEQLGVVDQSRHLWL